jgi:transcriptional regulator with XRE-family HTH domain
MTRNTIGAFIAILRKANGMTQKDLAEKLNVSDKTVSRWERDETAPDLSLLPILADLFEVSCDELLRGERLGEERRAAENEKTQARTQEQVKRLLKRSHTKLFTQTFIALGLAALGLVAAMAINYGAHRSGLAFISGLVFFISALVLEAISLIKALGANPEDASEAVSSYRTNAADLGYKAVSVILILLASMFPLILLPIAGHMGLGASTWLPHGFLSGVLAFTLCYALYGTVLRLLVRKGVLKNSPQINSPPPRIRRRFALCAALVVLLSVIAHVLLVSRPISNYVAGNSFFDAAEFKDYVEMNTDKSRQVIEQETIVDRGMSDTISISNADGTVTELSFSVFNREVAGIDWDLQGPETGKPFATVYTNDDYAMYTRMKQAVNERFAVIYVVEALLAAAVYHALKKRAVSAVS